MHNISRHERVRPLLRTRVVLKAIFSVDDGNVVVMAVGGREEDLRRRNTVWRADPCCGEPFRRWSSGAGVEHGTAGAVQTTQGFL